jgi:hypothetical protein
VAYAIERALRFDPGRRYGSALEMEAALTRASSIHVRSEAICCRAFPGRGGYKRAV